MFFSRTLLLFFTFLWSLQAGALPHRKSLDHKTNRFLKEGVFVGGRSGQGFSLLNVRRFFSKTAQTERIVLDLGDRKGIPLLRGIGFYHVGLDPKDSRVVVDLSQVSKAALDGKQLKKKLEKSPWLKSVEMLYDPIGNSTQLIMEFRTKVAVEVFHLVDDKKPTRLVLDFKSVGAVQ